MPTFDRWFPSSRWLRTGFGILAITGSALAFSGSGRQAYLDAQKYLQGSGRMTADEAERIKAMTLEERLQNGVKLLQEASTQASSPQETESVAQAMGLAHNQLSNHYAGTKDWKSAAFHADQAIQVRGSTSDPVLLSNLGHIQVAAGDYAGAVESFTKAKDAAKNETTRAQMVDSLVTAYYRQGETGDERGYRYAIQELEDALGRNPEDRDKLLILGRVYIQVGDDARALEAWDRAKAIGPLPEGVQKKYDQTKAATSIKATESFSKDRSAHFTIEFSDQQNVELGQKFLDLVEEAYEAVGAQFEVQPGGKVIVTVYASEQYDATVQLPWSAAVHQENRIDIRVNPKSSDTDYRNTIYHEYAHHLVQIKANGKHVPAYINEGLAMAMEPALNDAQFVSLLNKVVKIKNKYMPFALIRETFTALDNTTKVRLAYAQGYTVVQKMIERFRLPTILKVLERTGTGEPFEDAFFSITRITWKNFEQEWFQDRQALVQADTGPSHDGLVGGGH